MNEARCDQEILESFANDLFNEFAQSIEKNNGVECLKRVLYHFVWFWNNYESQILKVWWLISKVDTGVNDVLNICNAFVVRNQHFKMVLWNIIGSVCRQTITLFNCISEFCLGKEWLLR